MPPSAVPDLPAALQLSFGTPLILAALLVLPLLWWLLRVTPPLPRRTVFPPLKLLRGLEDEEQTPAATPWWLLALRLLAAALLIVALADPLLGQSPKLSAPGPLVLVIDNGWSAARDWQARQDVIAGWGQPRSSAAELPESLSIGGFVVELDDAVSCDIEFPSALGGNGDGADKIPGTDLTVGTHELKVHRSAPCTDPNSGVTLEITLHGFYVVS